MVTTDPPQHTAGESCESSESQQFIPSVEEQAETDRRTNRWHKQGARPKGSRDIRLSRVSRIAAVASSTPETAMTRLVSTGILQPPIHLENRFEALMNVDEESQNMTNSDRISQQLTLLLTGAQGRADSGIQLRAQPSPGL